ARGFRREFLGGGAAEMGGAMARGGRSAHRLALAGRRGPGTPPCRHRAHLGPHRARLGNGVQRFAIAMMESARAAALVSGPRYRFTFCTRVSGTRSFVPG